MTDEPMPDWMVEGLGGEYCDVPLAEEDATPDHKVDETVLLAGLPADATEEQKQAQLTAYAQLFPSEAVANFKKED